MNSNSPETAAISLKLQWTVCTDDKRWNLKSRLVLQVHDELLIETCKWNPQVSAILKKRWKVCKARRTEVDMHQVIYIRVWGEVMMITIELPGGVGAGKVQCLIFLKKSIRHMWWKQMRSASGDGAGASCYEPVIALFEDQIIKMINSLTADRFRM